MRAFPVIERYGFIGIWPGDADQADPHALHSLAWVESDERAYRGGLFHVKCDYRLMVDILMDLTHETDVHASSIGQREIDEAPVTTHAEGGESVTSRTKEAVGAIPFWYTALQMAGLPANGPGSTEPSRRIAASR